MEHFIRISDFILKSFLHIWPYLLVTIPLAVLINMTGASRFINRAYSKNIIISVLLATAVGAFSPLCSCGVIPVISSLLIGGVPIAPVMSFWIASPSMDPEIFFLSSSVSGWDLALWRLVSTLIISLFSGFMTYYITSLGFINAYGIKKKNRFPEIDVNVLRNAVKLTNLSGEDYSVKFLNRHGWLQSSWGLHFL
jgi:uncharacterized membrane protein YraQ (UPF0718 family)